MTKGKKANPAIQSLIECDESLKDEQLDSAARALGPLASDWLEPSLLLVKLGHEVSPLRPESGEMMILLALTRPHPHLRDGFVLPCLWRRGKDIDERLPPNLEKIACEIRKRVSVFLPEAADFSLTFRKSFPNLSMIDFPFESAAAILAAALFASVKGYAVDPLLTASASLSESKFESQSLEPGFCAVNSLKSKLAAARRHGINKVFVATGQPHFEDQTDEDYLKRMPPGLFQAQVGVLVNWIDVPPTCGTLDERADWYQRHQKGDTVRAGEFYDEHLACALADKAHITPGAPTQCSDFLFVNASGNTSTAVFSVAYHQPKHLFVLCDGTPEGDRCFEKIRQSLVSAKLTPPPVRVSRPKGEWHLMDLEIRKEVEKASSDIRIVDNDCLGIDLTGGETEFKLNMFWIAHNRRWRNFAVKTTMDTNGILQVMETAVKELIFKPQPSLSPKQTGESVDGLASLVGFSPETTIAMVEELRPKHLLLLASEESKSSVERIQEWLTHKASGLLKPQVTIATIDPLVPRSLLDKITSWITELQILKPATSIVLDATGGKKSMSVAAGMIASVLPIEIAYLESEYNPITRKPHPGSQRVVFLPPLGPQSPK